MLGDGGKHLPHSFSHSFFAFSARIRYLNVLVYAGCIIMGIVGTYRNWRDRRTGTVRGVGVEIESSVWPDFGPSGPWRDGVGAGP